MPIGLSIPVLPSPPDWGIGRQGNAERPAWAENTQRQLLNPVLVCHNSRLLAAITLGIKIRQPLTLSQGPERLRRQIN